MARAAWLAGLARAALPIEILLGQPATPGREEAPIVVLQGHLDVVPPGQVFAESGHGGLGLGDLVEGEDVQAGHVGVRRGERRRAQATSASPKKIASQTLRTESRTMIDWS